MVKPKVLLDSSVLIAFFNPKDSQHKKGVKAFKNLEEQEALLYLHPLVVVETLTVLKQRINIILLKEIESIIFNREIFERVEFDLNIRQNSQLIETFNKVKNISVVDAVLLMVSRELRLELLTFDFQLAKEV